ncbi:MAG: CPBP family glutamic-type intramembrane protease [Pseudonocardia sp.]|nr:CPBP family glutamic-type intramembrane protease [Pseudonocardia sp.]
MSLRYAQLAHPVLVGSRWRAAAALLVLVGGWVLCFAATMVLFTVTGAVDLVLDTGDPTSLRPAVLLVSLLVVPVSWLPPALAACRLLGVAPSNLCSVTGRFRWGWYGRCLGATAVLAALGAGLPLLWTDPPTLAPAGDWAVLVVVVVGLVPLQSFTEEFFCRGVLTHVLGARWANPLWAVVVPAVLSSLAFSVVHLAAGLILFTSRVIGAWRTPCCVTAPVSWRRRAPHTTPGTPPRSCRRSRSRPRRPAWEPRAWSRC